MHPLPDFSSPFLVPVSRQLPARAASLKTARTNRRGRSYSRLNNTQKMTFIAAALHVALKNPDISDALEPFGLTRADLHQGMALHRTVSSMRREQRHGYGTRIEQTARVVQLHEQVDKTFRKDRSIARAALRDRQDLVTKLGIDGRVPRNRGAFVLSGLHFYTSLMNVPGLRAELEPFGFSADFVRTRLDGVHELLDAMHDQQSKRADAISSTGGRREAMKELDDWMTQFIAIARLAFRSNKRQLKRMGIRP